MSDAETVVRSFVEAFAAGDRAAMGVLVADDVTAYVTNAKGGVDRVDGRDAYMKRIPDLDSAEYTITLAQSATVAPSQALAMVEIKATRGGKELHNFAAHLCHVRAGQIDEWWMVEALPAYSDEFWS
jgi:ketosteroid isomerase-like protein